MLPAHKNATINEEIKPIEWQIKLNVVSDGWKSEKIIARSPVRIRVIKKARIKEIRNFLIGFEPIENFIKKSPQKIIFRGEFFYYNQSSS